MPWENPAELLEGETLDSGWSVGARIARQAGDTGGTFSVGYLATGPAGEQGFLKALNLTHAFRSADPAKELERITAAYNFERELLVVCSERGMSKVVRILDHGIHQVDSADGSPFDRVNFIIFEVASGTLRAAVNAGEMMDVKIRLRSLHDAAVGVRQLHSAGIAHQDLKPSNVLTFSTPGLAKLGDLGRASDGTASVWHDELDIAGDSTYAPPEQLYKAVPLDFGPRRIACDLYQLGSLACYYFLGVHFNALLSDHLHPVHHWLNWRGTYTEVLPAVRDAFSQAVCDLNEVMTANDVPELAQIVEWLCDPEVAQRGDPASRRRPGQRYQLDRIISRLDRIRRRVEVASARVAS